MSSNNGLRDQQEAMRFVKRHINAFGGRPDDVTIFGELLLCWIRLRLALLQVRVLAAYLWVFTWSRLAVLTYLQLP